MNIQNYINGNFHNAIQDKWLDNYNPSNGEVYCQIPNSTNEDVENATSKEICTIFELALR
mgnify:CR=1 FL=1